MAKLNAKKQSITTHEGAKAQHINAELQLRRSVMSCLLWEKEFYESGESIADRIKDLIAKVDPKKVRDIAIEARTKMNLRHVPLLIAREMARLPLHKGLVSEVLSQIIQRPDELTEFLAIYWKDGRQPLSAQVKKGLARAFSKFDEYSLAKYNRDSTVKLRDVLFLCHAKPEDEGKEVLFKKLVDNTLETPDTWEVALSAGGDKKEIWTRLLNEKKLGGLALLRNLRNMIDAGVDMVLIKASLAVMKTDRILPFRFIAAAKYAPRIEPDIEVPMLKTCKDLQRLGGKTILLVDVSGSMDDKLSAKSEMTRLEAACGLAILLREICDDVEVMTFSNAIAVVPPRRGFSLRDAIVQSQSHGGTYLGQAIATVGAKFNADRIIVFTDEQSHDDVPTPKFEKCYMVNVASARNGIGYSHWTHIDGFSEAIVSYIVQSEASEI